jgi:hypothetical protein
MGACRERSSRRGRSGPYNFDEVGHVDPKEREERDGEDQVDGEGAARVIVALDLGLVEEGAARRRVCERCVWGVCG